MLGHPRLPSEFAIDAGTQRVGGIGLAVREVCHLGWAIGLFHPVENFVSVGVTGKALELNDLRLDWHVVSKHPEVIGAAREGSTSRAAGLEARKQDRITRI
jgi:hypothetical protein